MKEAEQKANQTERNKRYYMKKKLDAERKQVREAEQFEEEIAPQKLKHILTEIIAADIEFRKRFYENKFSYACSIFDRLWFSKDLRPPPAKGKDMLREEFKDEDINAFKVCKTCYKWLGNEQIPPLSRSNGFKYPQYPNDLPPLDCITERLVSPRLPFMQI